MIKPRVLELHSTKFLKTLSTAVKIWKPCYQEIRYNRGSKVNSSNLLNTIFLLSRIRHSGDLLSYP